MAASNATVVSLNPSRTILLPLTLVFVLLSGCATSADNDADTGASPDGPTTGTSDLTAPFEAPGSASHCQDTVAIFLTEPAELQVHLPANYTVADAAGLFGFPIGTGQAAAYVSGYDCPATDLAGGGPMQGGEISILIEAPKLSNGSVAPATLDWYLINWHTNGTAHQAILETYGLPYTNATVATEFDVVVNIHQGTIVVKDDAGPLVSYRFDAPHADPYTGLVRIWSEVPTGITYTDLDFKANVNGKGTISDCDFRTGTPYADVLGTDCADRPGLALVFYDQVYEGGFHYLPGVHAVK